MFREYKMKKEIEVEQNDEGYRVVGILDGNTVIAVSNRFLKAEWHLTQSSVLVGSLEESQQVLSLMNDVMLKVEELKNK